MALHILLVDDDADYADTIADSLRDSGHRVCTARDGGSALTLASELAPDVVLLDLRLPDFDGRYVARELRRSLPAVVPIIVVTGMRNENHGEDIDLLLNKPVPSEWFGGLIEYIRRRRMTLVAPRVPR